MSRRSAWVLGCAIAGSGLFALVQPAAAHAVGLSDPYRSAAIPTWLVVLTGASIIGASFLFTSLVTHHETIREVNRRGVTLPALASLRRPVTWLGRLLGLAALVGVLVVGFAGPAVGAANAAVLFVWAGWWAGYTISVYLLANTWPTLNPWRTLGRLLPRTGLRAYPARFGVWPAVAGLLALVYVEVVSPVADAPRWLATLVVAYTVLTLAGVVVYGVDDWFEHVDPVAGVFRYYGRLAPLQRTEDGVRLRYPGTAVTERREPLGADGTAFVVALLWVTTFDGFVTTSAWPAVAGPLVDAGVPALVVYLVAMLVGFGLFLGVYRLTAAWARRTADTYVSTRFVSGWFVAALLPIAAGYHLAHFLGYFLTLTPSLLALAAQPLSAPVTVPQGVLPGWFGGLQLAFVVAGHLLAVWIAHALSFEVFTGQLQPLRSQYPFVLVMILYTATSMWIVAQPQANPPFL